MYKNSWNRNKNTISGLNISNNNTDIKVKKFSVKKKECDATRMSKVLKDIIFNEKNKEKSKKRKGMDTKKEDTTEKEN